MSLHISSSTSKLGHEIPEIRIRALKHIQGQICRSLSQNEDIILNAGTLLKHLIRWFGLKPLCEEEIVLDVVITILKSKYANEAIRYLGPEILKKEFNKIFDIVKLKTSKTLIYEIISMLSLYQSPEKSEHSGSEAGSINLKSFSEVLYDGISSDYENPWTIPSVPDYNSLKLLADSIVSEGAEEDLEHAFKYLETAINDYPAEYFLQPPYIFNSLITLYNSNRLQPDIILKVLTNLTKSISGRIKIRHLSKTHCFSNEQIRAAPSNGMQISTNRFCTQLFRVCMDYLKELNESSNHVHSLLVFNLQMEIVDLMTINTQCYPLRNSFLIELGYLTKYYRESFKSENQINKLNRIYYVIILRVMIKLLKIESGISRGPSIPVDLKCAYNPDNYTASNESNQELMQDNDIWISEMERALLDFPLKEMFPELYMQIKIVAMDNAKKTFETLLDCANSLSSAVWVLRKYGEMSREELVNNGLKAVDSISLHKNYDFIRKLVHAISKCIPYYDGNDNMRENAEKLMLRLFAHENVDVRRVFYKETCDSVKSFFGSIMNGETVFNRNTSHSSKVTTFGIPLTADILNDIICFGYMDSDQNISTNAEMILSLIIKSKSIVGYYWQDVLEILLPNIPLLQCVCTGSSKLSYLLLNIFDPDSELKSEEVLKGNLRFMFSGDHEIRKEVLSRIIYIISIQPDSSSWTPNILEISDTIPNDILIVNFQKIYSGGLYEKTTVLALLELLKSPDVEPTIRKTAFMQLNVICQDGDFAEFVHDENGWCLALQALENSLKKDPSIDFPDTAIPAIGIIAKIALCHPTFRRELSQEENIYILLLRALFIHHRDIIFQQDCTLVLFLLVYSPYIMGSKLITMPQICSKLKIPIKCKFYSNSWQNTSLEEYYRICNSTDCSITEDFVSKESGLQYLRLTFATLWCNGYDNIVSALKSKRITKNLDHETNENILKLNDLLKNNTDLILRQSDIDLIKISSVEESINQFLHNISNATTHYEVLTNVAKIQLCSLGRSKSIDQKNILCVLKRFLITPPNNDQDIQLFEAVIALFIRLIDSDNKEILFWVLEDLKAKHCIFLSLLKNCDSSIQLYKINCQFLQFIVKKCIYYREVSEDNLYITLFEYIVPIVEECFHKRYLDKFRALLNLVQFITASGRVSLDKGFTVDIIKKMLYYMMTLKSFTQAGSHINKNCLLIIGNLIDDIREFIPDSKQLKCLSGLCGHIDFEIRLLGWCILEKISRFLNRAHLLVKELSYLPGGFHACCLSTFLDKSEVPIVRASAGGVLSNLLKYTKDSSNQKNINISVAPFCANLDSTLSEDGQRLILQMFAKHQLYERIEKSLESFYISDAILGNQNCTITTCDIVNMYCSIFINFVEFYPALLLEFFNKHSCFENIFRLIKNVPSCITVSSLGMMGSVCNLLLKFLQADSNVLQRFTTHDQSYIPILIDLLDFKLFEKIDKTCLINILQVLRILANESSAYQLICEKLKIDQFTSLFISCTECEDMILQQVALEFLTSILIKGQTESYSFCTFHEILDVPILSETYVSAPKKHEHTNMFDNKKNQLNRDVKTASQQLFESLNKLFINLISTNNRSKHKCEKLKQLIYCSEAMGILLKTSKHCHFIANRLQLFELVIDKLETIFNETGISCTDFIRKYGDSKKEPITKKLLILFSIILNWYSNDSLEDDNQILQLNKMLLKTWPWTNHSHELRINVLKLMVVLSENSLSVCKQFSSSIFGFSNTVLQLVITLVLHETAKIKSFQIDIAALESGLRIISNCCACIEGRLQIVKLNVLEIFNKFHPSVTKVQKKWDTIIILWLQFWEIYSRYNEGGTVRHISLLCTLIVKSSQEIRLLSITILRNMTFLNSNRAALLSSEDFLYIIKVILDDGRYEEQILVTVAIWRLIAGNCKGKHSIKSTSIPKKVKILRSEISKSNHITNDNLINVCDILINMLNT